MYRPPKGRNEIVIITWRARSRVIRVTHVIIISTCHSSPLQRRQTKDFIWWQRVAQCRSTDCNLIERASIIVNSMAWRRRGLSSGYVVQIDSSRESLYLMWLPNGVRLKRCSHHRRNPPPRRLQPSSILFLAPDEETENNILYINIVTYYQYITGCNYYVLRLYIFVLTFQKSNRLILYSRRTR